MSLDSLVSRNNTKRENLSAIANSSHSTKEQYYGVGNRHRHPYNMKLSIILSRRDLPVDK
jgi:hypothetical protein